MPKASLKFDLPEEQHEFNSAVNGGKWKAIVHQVTEKLRSVRKNSNSEEKRTFADKLISEIYEEMNSEGLTLD